MDHSHADDARNFTINGTSIHPETSTSRPTSARSTHSLTPSREGSTKKSPNASINFSNARQRRHSNSSQRSIQLTSVPADVKQSTSSSVFRMLSPRHDDADGFFTDQDQPKSGSIADDNEWNETRKWVNELHLLNSSFHTNEPTRTVGPLGMSRDSLNGTLAGTHLPKTNDDRRVQPVHTSTENASITIQRWYRKNRTQLQTLHANRIRKRKEKPFELPENPHQSTRIASLQLNQFDDRRPPTPNSPRPGSANSTASRHRTNPIASSRPPSRHDQKITPGHSLALSTTSKVTLDEVYETLKKLEEVEQFPVQSPLKDDSVYLRMNRSVSTTDESSPRTLTRTNSVSSFQDEPNVDDRVFDAVRAEKSSPRVMPIRTPPPSTRRDSFGKVTQSSSLPHTRVSTPRPTSQLTGVYKSLVIPASQSNSAREEKGDHSSRTFRTTQDIRDKLNQWKINNDGNQQESNSHPQVHNRDFLVFDQYIQSQKDEYEAIIQRHLTFIDQLEDDKKKLTGRCDQLALELQTIEKKSSDRIRSLEQLQRLEMQRLKDTHDAAEKLRRERWIEEKTKKIKELTVRGLEPEIQKLISKHKNELSKLTTVHQAELLTADERAAQRYIRLTEELRDQLEREKQDAVARERELARDKYEKALRDEQQSFVEQRRRLFAEIDDEKHRQTELITKQRADLDKLRRDIEDNHRTIVESNQRENEAIRLEQDRRHANEIQEIKDKFTLDRQQWEENLLKQQEMILSKKERELREQMKQERDKEIEKIIAQFESDTNTTKEETERTAESRVKRIREKYETEFRDLENSEKQMKERFNQIKGQITEVQGDNERLQILLKQKDGEMNDIKKIADTLQQERESLAEIIRQEFADRLVLTDDENRRIKGEIAELRARQQLELDKKKQEIDALRQQQDTELEAVHNKIKQAITKRDELVQGLRTQYDIAIKRAEHLEGLLTQQRKSLATIPSNTTRTTSRKIPQPS